MGVFEKLFGPKASQLKEKGDFGLEILVQLNHDKPRDRIKAFETISDFIEISPKNIFTAFNSIENKMIGGIPLAPNEAEQIGDFGAGIGLSSFYFEKMRRDGIIFQRLIYLALMAHTLFDKDESVRQKSAQIFGKLYNTTAINDLIAIFVKGGIGMKELELPWKMEKDGVYSPAGSWSKNYYTESEVQLNAFDALVREGVEISHIENEKKKIEENFNSPIVKHTTSEILQHYKKQ